MLGLTTVTEAVPETILKTALESSEAELPDVSSAATRTSALPEGGPGASQRQLVAESGRSWHSAIGAKLPPPSTSGLGSPTRVSLLWVRRPLLPCEALAL